MGQPANSIYCASKWAIEGWAEAICHELGPFRHRGRAGRAGAVHHRHLAELAPRLARRAGLRRSSDVFFVPARRICRARRRYAGGGSVSRTCSRRSGRRSAIRSVGSHASRISCAARCRAAAAAHGRPLSRPAAGAPSSIARLKELAAGSAVAILAKFRATIRLQPNSRRGDPQVPRQETTMDTRSLTRLAFAAAASLAAMPAAAAEDDCKTPSAEGKPASLRDLGAYPNSLLCVALRRQGQVRRGIQLLALCQGRQGRLRRKAGPWVCVRTAKPCKDLLSHVFDGAKKRSRKS